jgi:hypothetical protein
MLSMLSMYTLLVNCAISLLLHLLLFYLGDNCCILKISRYQLQSWWWQIHWNAVIQHVYNLLTVPFLGICFHTIYKCFNIMSRNMTINRVFYTNKSRHPMTSFIYDTLFSISTTHIGKQLPLILFAKMFRLCWNNAHSVFQTHII